MASIEEMFTKEEMYDANKYLSSEEILKNPRIALYNVMKNVQKIYEFQKEALSDEVVEYVINNNLKLPYYDSDCHELLYNYKLACYLIKLNPSLLSRVPENNLTEELIIIAFDAGFDFKNIRSKLLKNQTFLKLAISREPYVLNLVEQGSNVTDEIVKIASSKKYVFQFIGDREGKQLTNTSWGEDNYEPPKNNLHLLNNDEIVITSFVNGYESIIFEEEIPTKNKYYDYMLNKALTDRIPITNLRNIKLLENETFIKYLNENLFVTKQSRELMKKYLESKYITGNFEIVSYILRDQFVETFGLLTVDMIMKYLVCPKVEFKLDIVLKIIDEIKLKNIFDILIDKNGKHILLQMQNIVNYLAFNPMLLKNISSFDDEEIRKLRFVILENNVDIKINSKDDLNNINAIRYDYYDKNELNIKDKIFKYLTGNTIDSFYKMFVEKITSFRYKRFLMKSDINPIEDIDIISYLEYLDGLSNKTSDELFIIWNELKYNKIKPRMLDDIINSFKKRYFEYYKSNLTKTRGQKASYTIEDDVPVFEYNGQNFSFIIHAFNSFEFRSEISFNTASMFQNAIGRSYISTSYINQNHYKGALPRQGNLNFIFEDFSYENFIASSHNDIYTLGEENNTLDVTKHYSNYLDMFEMACFTIDYNEFAFYRVNNNGYRSLPSAVLCYDEIDDYAKAVAKSYQMPIVLIKTEMYKDLNDNLFNKYLNEVNNGNMKHIEELIGLSCKLFRRFDESKILEFYKKVSNEQKEFFIDCLKIYGYDDVFKHIDVTNCNKVKR